LQSISPRVTPHAFGVRKRWQCALPDTPSIHRSYGLPHLNAA